MPGDLGPPHGGQLVQLVAEPKGAKALLKRPWLVGDVVEGVRLPTHYDFRNLRHTPAELRTVFASRGCRRVVAFQTRNPIHRAHLELTLRAAAQEPLRRHEVKLGITMVPSQEMVYVEDLDRYVPRDEVPAGARTRSISRAEQRRHLSVLAHLQAEGYLSGAAAGG